MKETDSSLIKQYYALLKIEGVQVDFSESGIKKIAELSAVVNKNVEDIGARRLHTIIEKLLEDISFEADKMRDQKVTIDSVYVEEKVGNLAKHQDLSQFIL